jgi:polar amino acid transport system substrate-binding protein
MRRLLAAAAALAALLSATLAGAAVAPPTLTPDQLTVGVSLPSEGFQVGAVRGTEVVYARGLEIDLSRALAQRLGLRSVAFVQSRFDRLYSAADKPWDVGIAEITITPARRATVDFSIPYMKVDQGVLLAQTVKPAPRTIAGLRPLRLCALSKSTGVDVIADRIRPTVPFLRIGNVSRLMLALQTGRCQGVVYDAPALGTLKARAPLRYGAFAGVIRTGERYGIAFTKGSALRPPVNAALRELLEDGTIAALEKRWLTANLNRLPVLR